MRRSVCVCVYCVCVRVRMCVCRRPDAILLSLMDWKHYFYFFLKFFFFYLQGIWFAPCITLTCSFLIRYINYGNDSVLYNNYNYNNNYLSLLLILILSLCPVFPLHFFATHGVLCSLLPPLLTHIHFTQSPSSSPFLSLFQ